MMKRDDITGIVLSGGRSSRLGTEKGLAMLAGKELVTYPVHTLSALAPRILIGSSNAEYRKFGHPVIPDLYGPIGPIGGLYSCLSASPTEMNLVLSCDMPFVPAELMDHLLKSAGDAEVVLPSVDGFHPEPMCGLYRKSILATMERYINSGGYKLTGYFQDIRFRMIRLGPELPFYSEYIMTNINTPEELHHAAHILGQNPFLSHS